MAVGLFKFLSFLARRQAPTELAQPAPTPASSTTSTATNTGATANPFISFPSLTDSLGIVTGLPEPATTGSTAPSTAQGFATTLLETGVTTNLVTVPISSTAGPTVATNTLSTSSVQNTDSPSSGTSSGTSSSSKPTQSSSPDTGLSSSDKVGIGLGVPLGVLVIGLMAFLLVYYQRKRKRAGRRDDEAPPDIREKGNSSVHETMDAKDQEAQEPQGLGGDVHEIAEGEVPQYSRELEGSPGVWRHELPTRRGSV